MGFNGQSILLFFANSTNSFQDEGKKLIKSFLNTETCVAASIAKAH